MLGWCFIKIACAFYIKIIKSLSAIIYHILQVLCGLYYKV